MKFRALSFTTAILYCTVRRGALSDKLTLIPRCVEILGSRVSRSHAFPIPSQTVLYRSRILLCATGILLKMCSCRKCVIVGLQWKWVLDCWYCTCVNVIVTDVFVGYLVMCFPAFISRVLHEAYRCYFHTCSLGTSYFRLHISRLWVWIWPMTWSLHFLRANTIIYRRTVNTDKAGTYMVAVMHSIVRMR